MVTGPRIQSINFFTGGTDSSILLMIKRVRRERPQPIYGNKDVRPVEIVTGETPRPTESPNSITKPSFVETFIFRPVN